MQIICEVEAIAESFQESGILVTQPKVNLQTTTLATQLLKIKDQSECLIQLIVTIDSAHYTIEEVVQAIPELDFEDICSINRYIKKMLNNSISKTINIARLDFSPVVYSLLQDVSAQLLL